MSLSYESYDSYDNFSIWWALLYFSRIALCPCSTPNLRRDSSNNSAKHKSKQCNCSISRISTILQQLWRTQAHENDVCSLCSICVYLHDAVMGLGSNGNWTLQHAASPSVLSKKKLSRHPSLRSCGLLTTAEHVATEPFHDKSMNHWLKLCQHQRSLSPCCLQLLNPWNNPQTLIADLFGVLHSVLDQRSFVHLLNDLLCVEHVGRRYQSKTTTCSRSKTEYISKSSHTSPTVFDFWW